MTTLPFSPLTLRELNYRVQDANATIAHIVRWARRNQRPLDDFDLARMATEADEANAYAEAAKQRADAIMVGRRAS